MASALPPTGMSSPILPRASSNSNTFPLSAARKLNLQPRAAAAIDFNDSDDDDENGLLSADYKAQRRTTQDLVDFFKSAPPPPSSTPIPLFMPPEEEKKKRSLLQRLRPRKSASSSKSSSIRASSIISSTTMGNATVGLASNRSSVLVPGKNGLGSTTSNGVYASSKVPGTSSSISAVSALTNPKSKVDNSDKRSTMSSKKYVMISIDYAGGEAPHPGYAPSVTASIPGSAYDGSNTRPSSMGAGVGGGSTTTAGVSENLLGGSKRQSQSTERDDFANLFSSNRLSLLSSGAGIGLGTSLSTATATSSTLPSPTSATSGLSSAGQQSGGPSTVSPPMASQETVDRRSLLLQTAGLDATPFLLDNFGLGSDFLNGISVNNLASTGDNLGNNSASTSPTTAVASNMGATPAGGKGIFATSSSPTATSPNTATAVDPTTPIQSMNGNLYGGSNTMASSTPTGTHQRSLSVRSNQTASTAKPYVAEEMAKADNSSSTGSNAAGFAASGHGSHRNSRATLNAMQHIIAAAGPDGIGHHAQLLLDEDIVTEALLQRIESHKARKLSHQSTSTSSEGGSTAQAADLTATSGVEASEETEITLPKPVSRKKVRHVQIQTMHCVTRPMYTQTESSEPIMPDDLEVKAWRRHSAHYPAGQGERRHRSASSSSSQTEFHHGGHHRPYRSNGPRPSGLITSLAQPTSATAVTSTTTATSTMISTTTMMTTSTADHLSSLAAGISPHPQPQHHNHNHHHHHHTVTTQTSSASMSSASPLSATLSTATMTNHSTSSATTSACSSPSSPSSSSAETTTALSTEQELALSRQHNLQLQQQIIRLERELASEMRARARSAVAMQDTRDKFEMLSALAYKKLKEMIFQRHILEMEVRELRGQSGGEIGGGPGKQGANALMSSPSAPGAPNASSLTTVVRMFDGDDASKAALLVACAD